MHVLELVEPTLELEPDLRALAREYLQEGNEYERRTYAEALADAPGFIRRLLEMARGQNLPDGFVPHTTYWLVRDARTGSPIATDRDWGPRIVAVSNLRHELTEHLLYEGGHIGYGTRPSERRRGYGREVCRLTLQRARELGLRRLLITCDADNLASARIIEANGGVLENQVISRVTGKCKKRYWVQF